MYETKLTGAEWKALLRSVRGVVRATDVTIHTGSCRYDGIGLNRPARSRREFVVETPDDWETGGDILMVSPRSAILIQEKPWTPVAEAPVLGGFVTGWTWAVPLLAFRIWPALLARLREFGIMIDHERVVIRAAMPTLAGYNGPRPVFLAADVRLEGRPKKVLQGNARIWDAASDPSIIPAFEQGYLGDVYIPDTPEGEFGPAASVGVITPDGEVAFAVTVRPGTVLAAGDRLRPVTMTVKGDRPVVLTVAA